jgi:predicted dehydrogenase
MKSPLRMAVVGVGRIGIFHAQHAQELAHTRGDCELVAVVDGFAGAAQRARDQLQPGQSRPIATFDDVDALVESDACDVAVVASRTADHHTDAKALVDAGMRVLLEKPLTHSLESASALATYLNGDPTRQRTVMLAFMRRFDPALLHAKRLLEQGAIGKLFKVVSILGDPAGPPTGYDSAGLLVDMAVHNTDEVMWLTGGRKPTAVTGAGSRLYNQMNTSVVEDFDDSFLQMWFEDDLVAQVQVSRNHVAGYRNETVLYGETGLIHVGAFRGNAGSVTVEHYGGDGLVDERCFKTRDYGREVPVFITRFGQAYAAELDEFIDKCLADQAFSVDHDDGLRALQVVTDGMGSQVTRAQAAPVAWKHPN